MNGNRSGREQGAAGRLAVAALSVAAVAVAAAVGYRVGFGVRPGAADPAGAPGPMAAGGSELTEPAWLEIPAPDVEFRTAEGGTARLSDYRGKVVLLNFWGTWCPPCLVEIPHLIEVQERLAELGGTIIGPAVDSGGGEDVLRFAAEQGINYPLWLSDYNVAVGEFGAAGYPFSVLIDRRGVIRRQYLGPQTARRLLRDIGALLVREDRSGS